MSLRRGPERYGLHIAARLQARRATRRARLAVLAAVVAPVAAMWWAAASTTQGFLEMSGQRSGMPVQGQRWWWAVVVVMAVSALVGAFAERSWLPGLLVTESVAAVVFCWFWRYRYGIDSPEIAWDYVVDIVSASVFLMLPASFALYVGVLARRLGRWLQPRRPEPTVGAPPLRS